MTSDLRESFASTDHFVRLPIKRLFPNFEVTVRISLLLIFKCEKYLILCFSSPNEYTSNDNTSLQLTFSNVSKMDKWIGPLFSRQVFLINSRLTNFSGGFCLDIRF